MRVKLMNELEYERSKSLWAACFPEDSEDFISVYYAMRSRPEYALGAFENTDEPIAMMHMLPFKMELDGRREPVCFVAGVCTSPGFRGRGICTAMFDRALVYMREYGFSYCLLSPSDPAFYRRLGFKSFFETKQLEISYVRPKCFGRTYDPIPASFLHDPAKTPDPLELCSLYERVTKGVNGRLIKTPEYFNAFIAEFSLPGAFMTVTNDGCCAGYASADGKCFEAIQLFSAEGSFTKLLPDGFINYTVPLPTYAEIPLMEGATVRVRYRTAQMIRPVLKPLPDACKPYYGYDSY